jgi:pSer/pThr/pTyr-binding forkhead associated (FHA) protein
VSQDPAGEERFVAQLTLSFKGRRLKVFALQAGDCIIGRAPDCTIRIDSLAVAPRHARVHCEDDSCLIEPLDPEHPLSVQDQPVAEAHRLEEGDLIQIGKHNLSFSFDSPVSQDEPPAPAATVVRLPAIGWLQIQNGPHLGRTIRLNKAFSRIGKPDGELAVIAHRDDGYFLSMLRGDEGPRVNGQSIGESRHRLEENDQVEIGELRVQFFSENLPVMSPDVPEPVRGFSRIACDTSVTLLDGQQSWSGRLLDISLNGALIRAPDSFPQDDDRIYELTVHLEDGPDVCMEVAIVRRKDDTIGFECTAIDVDSIKRLRELMDLDQSDPALLERDFSSLG